MIENSFLESGFSFTMAKIIPYLVVILIGICVVFLFRNKLKFKKRILTILVRLVVLVIPFAIYFRFYPIYEGDFSNAARKVSRTDKNSELLDEKLYVLSIPGCPYCAQAMSRMLQLKDRNPDLQIEYIVVSSDSTSTKDYETMGKGEIEVSLAQNMEEMSKIALGGYPSFVLSEKGNSLSAWSNDGFGVRALDQVELSAKN